MATIDEAMMSAARCQQSGQFREAANICRQIVAADPTNVGAWHLLGIAACQVGALDLAVQCINHAIELAPSHADAHNSLGIALRQQGRLDEAVASCRRAVELNPAIASAHYNLANVLQAQGSLDDAVASYRQALRRDPDNAEIHNNLGNTLRELGVLAEAARCIEQALAFNPHSVAAHMNLASLLLLQGSFDRGWHEYEWRWHASPTPPREFGQPLWDGGPLVAKTILLHGEQGLGDTLQFIRYAPLIQSLGATVVVEEQSRLIPLLARSAGIDRLVASGDELPPYDFHLPLLSLPRVFKTRLETIPAHIPYLFADPALVARWREKLEGMLKRQRSTHGQVPPGERDLLVGINWHGREGQGEFRKRDIPLELFQSLARISGVRLISLQKGHRVGSAHHSERAPASTHGPVISDAGDDVDTAAGAFMDTAAIMMNLDLVITSDTAIPHLAGGLGVPVWLALPHIADWRWLLDRSDSPWYPTMRLFRQRRRGDWAGVFDEVCCALRTMVDCRR